MAVLVAVGLFTGMSVAPVAAADDGLDIGEDGIEIGGDDGISVGVGADDGVEVGAGGEEGVQVGAGPDDGVEVGAGGEEGVQVGAGPDDGVNASVAGDEGVQVGAGPDDGVEASVAGKDVTDGAPDDVVSGVETLDSNGVNEQATGSLPGTNGSFVPGTNGTFGPGTGEGLNLTAITGVDVCELLRVSNNKLPTGSLPGLDSLPSEFAPPGVPTNLLTTETVVGLVTGAIPGGCEVVDLEDPQLDPTDPPTEPDQTAEVMRFSRVDNGLAATFLYKGTLNESGDGPSIDTSPGMFLSPTVQDVRPDFVLNVGEGDYGADPVIRRNNDSIRLQGVIILVGDRAGVDVECTDMKEFDGDLSEENLADLGPCDYELIGLPSLVTPEDAFQILGSLGEGPGIDPGNLPIDPGQLLGL
jgi:hypothetical protein